MKPTNSAAFKVAITETQQTAPSAILDIPQVATLADVGPKKADNGSKPYHGPKLSPKERRLLAGHEKTIREGLDGMFEHHIKVGRAMLEIQTKKLYREKFKTWDSYCSDVYNVARSRSYELVAAAQVVKNLSAMAELSVAPQNERQIRPLTLLKNADDRTSAWKRAIEMAGDKEITGVVVRQAVDEIKAEGEAEAKAKKAETVETPSEDLGQDWATDIQTKLLADGAEKVATQPFNWPNNAVELQLKGEKFVKIIETLDFETAACAIELREKCSECLVLINADVNSREGLYISESGDEIIDSFGAPFNAIAVKIGALLEDAGNIYMAGDKDDVAKLTWHRLSPEILGDLGLLALAAE